MYKNNTKEKKIFLTNQSVASEKIAHIYRAFLDTTYTSALQGFSITVTHQNKEQFLKDVRNNPMVASVLIYLHSVPI